MTSSTALCKYRWAKVLSTDSPDVGFYPSYAPTEPILLSWDAAFKAYLSPELRIECGSYHGVLKVDGNPHHVEDFLVKSYTFEVDLFIKEDILESKCPSPPTLEFRSSPSNPGCAAPIPTNSLTQSTSAVPDGSEASKVDDIVRPQLTPKEDSDLTPTRESGGILASSLARSSVMERSSPLINSSGGDESMAASILKASSPLLQSTPVRRASPIGDDKTGELGKPDHQYHDPTRIRGERPYSAASDQPHGVDRLTTVANESAKQTKIGSKLVDDIIAERVGGRKDEDGVPARGSSRGSSHSEEAGGISDFKKHERDDGCRVENGHGQHQSQSYPARSTSGDLASSEERSSSYQLSKYSQHEAERPKDGIYGRPPSQPCNSRKEEEPPSYSSRECVSGDIRYPEYDRRSPGSSSSRDRIRDVDKDFSVRSRDRLPHERENEDDYNRSGSRPPSVPSTHSFRDKDGRQGSYVEAEGRPRSGMSRGSREGSYMGSQHSSRTNSHTSLTSEQELGQYWDNEHRDSRDRMQHKEGLSDPDFSRGARLDRPASMPNYGSRSEAVSDKRSNTPDNRVRVPTSSWSRPDSSGGGHQPALRSSLSTERVTEMARGGRSSVASSDGRRTVTPGLGSREVEAGDTEELRNTVENLRQLVSRRDSEIRGLRDELQEVKDDRASRQRDARTSHSSGDRVQNTLEYKQLQSEKEILATEVVGLREEVQRLTGRHHSGGRAGGAGGAGEGGGGRPSPAISDYSPYSPMVLQRKIADLESQIHDLQEVNEATTSSLSRTEEKVRLLQEENHDLRSRAGNSVEDSGDQHSLRVQMRTLREDIASLRERNFQLTEDNMRLQEGQGSRTNATGTGLTLQRSGSSLGLKSDDSQAKHSTTHIGTSASAYGTRYQSTSSKGSESSRQLLGYSSRLSREDLAPKDYRSRGSSLGRAYDSDHQSSAADISGSKMLHQRNAQDSPRLRFSSSGSDVISHKPPNPSLTSRSAISTSLSVADRDRYRPDGEVSEHVHSDRYRPAIRSSYDSLQQDRGTKTPPKDNQSQKFGSYSSRRDRPSSLTKDSNSYGDYRKEDSYMAYLSDSKLDRQTSGNQSKKRPSPENSLGSKDIFMNLKKKLASQWLQQENRYISGNLEFDRYQTSSSRDRVEEDADDSDTATDILLAQDTGTTQVSFRSGKSPGSDGTGESLSDEAADDVEGHLGGPTSLRRRCRSADPGNSLRHSSDSWRNTTTSGSRNLQQVSSATAQRSQRSTSGGPPSSYRGPSSSGAGSAGEDRDNMRSVSTAGHRSVLPTPLVTQHNKHEMTKNGASLLNSTLTQGLRPFAPRSPADIRVDDVVKFSRLGGKLTQGCVKYVGHLPGRSEVYLGVELDKDEGKHDGTFEDVRYFKCKANKGVFVAFNKVVMAWAP